MKKLQHTRAPITQANSTNTMDKINEIIDVMDGMNQRLQDATKKITKIEGRLDELEDEVSIEISADMSKDIENLEKRVDKLEDE